MDARGKRPRRSSTLTPPSGAVGPLIKGATSQRTSGRCARVRGGACKTPPSRVPLVLTPGGANPPEEPAKGKGTDYYWRVSPDVLRRRPLAALLAEGGTQSQRPDRL